MSVYPFLDGNGLIYRRFLPPSGEIVPGCMDFLPFRPGEQPFGWYFMNGDKYAQASVQGVALLALPANFRTDWSIVLSGGLVNVPNWFDSAGDGYFPRAVNGSTRKPGSVQTDAIRDIIGEIKNISIHNPTVDHTGAFYSNTTSTNSSLMGQTPFSGIDREFTVFKASRVVPTAAENRPKNRGLLPCIWLAA
jgi:hypothetical protein